MAWACVAIAPTSDCAQETIDPTARNLLATATPNELSFGSDATIEKVLTLIDIGWPNMNYILYTIHIIKQSVRDRHSMWKFNKTGDTNYVTTLPRAICVLQQLQPNS